LEGKVTCRLHTESLPKEKNELYGGEHGPVSGQWSNSTQDPLFDVTYFHEGDMAPFLAEITLMFFGHNSS
jgi:hypothetical protein